MSPRPSARSIRVTVTPWWWLWLWCCRHRRWLAAWIVLAGLAWAVGASRTALEFLAMAAAPGLVAMVWVQVSVSSYDRLVAGPARRLRWWWHLRHRWLALCRACGLAVRLDRRIRLDGRRVGPERWSVPRLCRVRTRSQLVRLRVRARPGQTLEELEAAAPRLAATMGAESYRTRAVSGPTVQFELIMRDTLTAEVFAVEPEPRALVDQVRLGRTQTGEDWRLPVRGRHTLVAGCSGAGKGSVLWGICCGLAPAVRTDLVRLWGVDLKRGVELATGAGLFSAHAYTPTDALMVLRQLMGVIDARGAAMVGRTRLHQPIVGDPLHVLVIDELAALTAYAEPEIRREASRLLAEILTQGRALGVVVVACVQDPRKDVVAMRGLFTQTVALRLRSIEETAMVLGDGIACTAPAHRISPLQPGVGWIVEDTGAADRVRADYWPDDLIRDLAGRYRTEVHHEPEQADAGAWRGHDAAFEPLRPVTDQPTASAAPTGSARRRKPRSPRKPRQRTGSGDRARDGAA